MQKSSCMLIFFEMLLISHHLLLEKNKICLCAQCSVFLHVWNPKQSRSGPHFLSGERGARRLPDRKWGGNQKTLGESMSTWFFSATQELLTACYLNYQHVSSVHWWSPGAGLPDVNPLTPSATLRTSPFHSRNLCWFNYPASFHTTTICSDSSHPSHSTPLVHPWLTLGPSPVKNILAC